MSVGIAVCVQQMGGVFAVVLVVGVVALIHIVVIVSVVVVVLMYVVVVCCDVVCVFAAGGVAVVGKIVVHLVVVARAGTWFVGVLVLIDVLSVFIAQYVQFVCWCVVTVFVCVFFCVCCVIL